MLPMFKGQPIFGPQGPAGPDGNPIGTVISYMGTKAPTGYLICDGTIYNISDYPKLAEFFKTQFGAANYFGGDGAATFAVPDMRNLFLRGFHGTSEEQLSADVGVKQEATSHIALTPHSNGILYAPLSNAVVENYDSVTKGTIINYNPRGDRTTDNVSYTSRPVNMAVLYCIKATEAESYEDIYSTEETRIGTWIDGKPLYRRVINAVTLETLNVWQQLVPLPSEFEIVYFYAYFFTEAGDKLRPLPNTKTEVSVQRPNALSVWLTDTLFINTPIRFIVKYTKTTDPG